MNCGGSGDRQAKRSFLSRMILKRALRLAHTPLLCWQGGPPAHIVGEIAPTDEQRNPETQDFAQCAARLRALIAH
jgi:hypothetical protein